MGIATCGVCGQASTGASRGPGCAPGHVPGDGRGCCAIHRRSNNTFFHFEILALQCDYPDLNLAVSGHDTQDVAFHVSQLRTMLSHRNLYDFGVHLCRHPSLHSPATIHSPVHRPVIAAIGPSLVQNHTTLPRGVPTQPPHPFPTSCPTQSPPPFQTLPSQRWASLHDAWRVAGG